MDLTALSAQQVSLHFSGHVLLLTGQFCVPFRADPRGENRQRVSHYT